MKHKKPPALVPSCGFLLPSFANTLVKREYLFTRRLFHASSFRLFALASPRSVRIQQILDNAEKQLGIEKPDDWYAVNLTDLRELGFPATLRWANLIELLSEKYPNHTWDKMYILRGRYGQQNRLKKTISTLFPNVEIKENVRRESGLLNPATNAYFEIDLYLPSLNLAFEYQDLYHYVDASGPFTSVDDAKERDAAKKRVAEIEGLDLIEVPCWWDGQTESLLATIAKKLPGLAEKMGFQVPKDAEPIPEEMPPGFPKQRTYNVEGIGQPTNATFFSASALKVNTAGWWLFEKYDGVRGFWNPSKKQFYSRLGNVVDVPLDIIKTMPTDMMLDGELWFGREAFQESIKMVRKAQNNWSNFKYMVFDIPGTQGTYAERYNRLVEYIAGHPSKYIEVAPKIECKDETHMEEFFHSIIEQGGEGIIIRDPNEQYKPGKSSGYLKHKKFRDAEARLVKQINVNEWECELPNGVKFVAVVGTREFAKKWQPKPGDIASFKHHGYLLSSKKPKFPAIYRLRPDLTWQHVVDNWKEPKNRQPNAPPLRRKYRKKEVKPLGYWRDLSHRRQFFVDYASKKGFDPLVPENWHNVDMKELRKEAKGLWLYLHGSFTTMLAEAFPEVQFTEQWKPHQWKDVNNCREFFDAFAKAKGFNPLDVRKWYSITRPQFDSQPGAKGLFEAQGGFKKALIKAYPELKFTRWTKLKVNEEMDPKSIKEWFDKIATQKGINPYQSESWKTIKLKELWQAAGGRTLGSRLGLEKALRLAYPDVKFSARPFWTAKEKMKN